MNQVIFICTTCEDFNKQYLGTDGFIQQQTEFESLTEATEHILSTKIADGQAHYLEAKLGQELSK